MIEEIEETKREKGATPEDDAQDRPQVYSVKKGLEGWKFSRREFIAATAAAAAAATAVAAGVANKAGVMVSEVGDEQGDLLTLAMTALALAVVGPAQPFVQYWRFTNNSPTVWCRGARLHLTDGEKVQAPASVQVPDIAPGETVAVQVDLVAPAEPGVHQSGWQLHIGDDETPAASGTFVVQAGCIAESAHPYENDTFQTWTVTNPDSSAERTRVHFSQVDVEMGWDYVILMDGTKQEIQRITGSYPSGLWSNSIPGTTVLVVLQTDSSVTGWGFCLDQVETDLTVSYYVYLPLVIKQPTPTNTPLPTATPCACYGVCSCHGVCSCVGHCSCNPHCTCDQVCTCDVIHYWYPN